MFAKNKPTKRINFSDENWVEIQYLSKGQKNAFASKLAELFKGQEFDGDGNDNKRLPDVSVAKIHEVEYEKMVASIKAWSAEEDITIENVQALDDSVYEEISNKIKEMNELSEEEEKN
jgi:hypothetical protein